MEKFHPERIRQIELARQHYAREKIILILRTIKRHQSQKRTILKEKKNARQMGQGKME